MPYPIPSKEQKPPLNEVVLALNLVGIVGAASWNGTCWITFIAKNEVDEGSVPYWIYFEGT